TLIYDAKAVRQRFGLEPGQMVDFRALKGDPSDNIPGVKGIGEKTASDLIQQFGSLDNLYKKVKKAKTADDLNLKSRIFNLLLEQEAGARQSYELSTIKCDVPVEIHVPKYEFTKDNFELAFKLFQELEFKSLVSKLPKTYGSTVTPEEFEIAGAA